MFDELSTWGWLPLALPLLVFSGRGLGLLFFGDAPRPERVAASVVLTMTQVHATVGLLGELGGVTREALLLVLAVQAAVVAWLTRGRWRSSAWAEVVREAAVPVVAVLALVTMVVVVARLLPVWQWDSIGYHLPFVNLVLQQRGFSGVPIDLRYITTYPHNVELGMIWWRAFLPDDRLVDVAQVPYGVGGAILTAVIARHLGATRSLSAWAAAAWLAVPSVLLQLPTNYVDLGVATSLLAATYFLVLAPVTARTLVVGGLALGLLLGSKPSAPMAVAALSIIAAVRAWRAAQLPMLGLGAIAVLVFGAQQYLVMLLRHGNPIWPVEVHLGPLTLSGTHSVGELLAAGQALPHAEGGLIAKLGVSWLAITTPAVFDMKLGGLGLLFLLALPLAVFGVVRRRAWPVGLALALALLSPDPSNPRYVLALPALVFAVAAAQLRGRATAFAPGVVLLACGWQVHHAWPGFTGEGPALGQYLAMGDAERRLAVGPQGAPTDYTALWAGVGRGESVAFDIDFEFPGLLWAPDGHYPVVALERAMSSQALAAVVRERQVRFVAVGPANAEALGGTGVPWRRLFSCRSAECAVFVREEPAWADRR